ncbi:serine/threonine-protein kinase pim-1-like [Brachionichthys hirsutus]|uniref:serine/threonine-protein kinase pim-1-like n=1 Tax=Brachionichthys hirsutus TaxID=412623 RepID=UPI0036052F76
MTSPVISSPLRASSPVDNREKVGLKKRASKSPERDRKRRASPSASRPLTAHGATDPPGSTGVNERKRRRRRGGLLPSDDSDSSVSGSTVPTDAREVFNLKYWEGALVGKGGFGSVFRGFRRSDYLPVAIKHIRLGASKPNSVMVNGRRIPLEVALMLVLGSGGGTSGVVALLDWYELRDELILVMERPLPCTDLMAYLQSRRYSLEESEAKSIMKQLVDTLITIQSKGVLHRDLKPDNILVRPSPHGPRVSIVDFGCGTMPMGKKLKTGPGTRPYTCPEWIRSGCNRAEPLTVWQLGVVMYLMFHPHFPFNGATEIISKDAGVREDLSSDCKDFLQGCLCKRPNSRSSLQTLKDHPWIQI